MPPIRGSLSLQVCVCVAFYVCACIVVITTKFVCNLNAMPTFYGHIHIWNHVCLSMFCLLLFLCYGHFRFCCNLLLLLSGHYVRCHHNVRKCSSLPWSFVDFNTRQLWDRFRQLNSLSSLFILANGNSKLVSCLPRKHNQSAANERQMQWAKTKNSQPAQNPFANSLALINVYNQSDAVTRQRQQSLQ